MTSDPIRTIGRSRDQGAVALAVRASENPPAVLTIRAAKSPGYYEEPEFARDDYYRERGEVPGLWSGRGARALGLEGSPQRGQLAALQEGRDPEDGERLQGLRQGRRNAGF